MADVQTAVEAVMREEDSTLSGKITTIPGDVGGKTRFGLASRFHPELESTEFYTTMPTDEALALAESTMARTYAAPLMIEQIADQALATKFLSYGVNEDPERAVQAMQFALNVLLPDARIVADSKMGPLTLAAIKRCMPISLLNAFKLEMIQRYVIYAKDNVLRGLVNRALA